MSKNIRLIYTDISGAEHVRDFATVEEVRAVVNESRKPGNDEWIDYVVFEINPPGPYSVVGRVLDTI